MALEVRGVLYEDMMFVMEAMGVEVRMLLSGSIEILLGVVMPRVVEVLIQRDASTCWVAVLLKVEVRRCEICSKSLLMLNLLQLNTQVFTDSEWLWRQSKRI